jgi:c(7)-type cytochrome triheme protein
MKPARLAALALTVALAAIAAPAAAEDAKALYARRCSACHDAGILGAPKPGSAADWGPRLKGGREALYKSAARGTPKGMPPRGGDATISDRDLRAVVDLMSGAPPAAAAKPAEKVADKPAPPKAVEKRATPAAQAAEAAAAPAALPPAPSPAPQPVAVAAASLAPASSQPAVPEPGNGAAESNTFNRLLKAPGKRNLPPMEDGIHDPAGDGTALLQPPLSSFAAMPRANAGNRVDWVRSLEQKKIAPRWDREKADATAMVMDLNIVREVKGSMPDVVYPHKQHTEWLDCATCHPAIFVPQKGANAMSMASILLGQGCGACHGRVAFPVSECRLCHSRKKEVAQQASQQAAGSKP